MYRLSFKNLKNKHTHTHTHREKEREREYSNKRYSSHKQSTTVLNFDSAGHSNIWIPFRYRKSYILRVSYSAWFSSFFIIYFLLHILDFDASAEISTSGKRACVSVTAMIVAISTWFCNGKGKKSRKSKRETERYRVHILSRFRRFRMEKISENPNRIDAVSLNINFKEGYWFRCFYTGQRGSKLREILKSNNNNNNNNMQK